MNTNIVPLPTPEASISPININSQQEQKIKAANIRVANILRVDKDWCFVFGMDGKLHISIQDQSNFTNIFLHYLKSDLPMAERFFTALDEDDFSHHYSIIVKILRHYWMTYKKLPSLDSFIIMMTKDPKYIDSPSFKEGIDLWIADWDKENNPNDREFISDIFVQIMEGIVKSRLADSIHSFSERGGVNMESIRPYMEKLESIGQLYSDAQKASNDLLDCTLSGNELLDLEIPENQSLVEGIIDRDSLTILAAQAGVGKSFFCYELALSIMDGEKFMNNYPVRQTGRVLLIDGEMPLRSIKNRFSRLSQGRSLDRLDILASEELVRNGKNRLNIVDLQCQKNIETYLKSLEARGRRPDLLIFDNLSSLMSGIDMNDNKAVEPLQQWAIKLRGMGYACLFVHHMGKNRDAGSRGASKLMDFVTLEIFLNLVKEKVRPDHCEFILSFGKRRELSPKPDKLGCELIDWEWHTEVKEESYTKKTKAEMRIETDTYDNTIKKIVEEGIKNIKQLGMKERTIREHRKKLVERGYIQVDELGAITITQEGNDKYILLTSW